MVFLIFLLVVFFWLLLITVLRFSSELGKKDCPKCGKELERIPRKSFDKLLEFISFSIVKLGRYKCPSCRWQGLRERK
jgi:uncharacterized protein (UPF0212 family)